MVSEAKNRVDEIAAHHDSSVLSRVSTRSSYFLLVECYKIVFRLSHLDFHDYFEFAKATHTRANHSYKLYVKSSGLNCYKHSFECFNDDCEGME